MGIGIGPEHPARHQLALMRCVTALALLGAAHAQAVAPYVNLGSVEAVEGLLERVLPPGGKEHFVLALAPTCPGSEPPCFVLEDADPLFQQTKFTAG